MQYFNFPEKMCLLNGEVGIHGSMWYVCNDGHNKLQGVWKTKLA